MTTNCKKPLQIQIVNPLEDRSWDRELASHPEASIFHEAAWAKVLAETYGHVPVYLRIIHEHQLVALVPMMEINNWPKGRRGVASPFADRCEPLIFAQGMNAQLLDAIASLSKLRGWSYAELRGLPSSGEVSESVEAVTFHGHELELSGSEESQLGLLDGSAKRSLRKSQRSDLTVSLTATWPAVLKFFRLHEMTRRKHGVPPQSLDFFRNIHSAILKVGKGFVSLVEKDGIPIAGAVFLHTGKKAIYKFGASDPNCLSERPNHLAMWEGIRALAAKGCSLLDFGRTSPAQEGLRRYKRSWGAREIDVRYLYFSAGVDGWEIKTSSLPSRYLSGFRYMPLIANRLAGRLLYPHLD